MAPAATPPRLEDLQVDATVVGVGLALSIGTALLIAIFPILRAGRMEPGRLSDGGRGATAGRERQRVRSVLVVTQVALALILIIGASLLVESFQRLRGLDAGSLPLE